MKRNLFLCCNRGDRQKYRGKIKKAFGNSVKLVDAMEQADLIYTIGKVSPEMQKELDQAKLAGIREVYVNENLINEEVYRRTLNYRSRDAERGR